MLLVNGNDWTPTAEQLDKLQDMFPDINIPEKIEELNQMFYYNIAQRRTLSEISKYVTDYMRSATINALNNRENGNKPIPLKQWTALDDLTHDFTDSPEIRESFLKKYGQYMSHDGHRVTQ